MQHIVSTECSEHRAMKIDFGHILSVFWTQKVDDINIYGMNSNMRCSLVICVKCVRKH